MLIDFCLSIFRFVGLFILIKFLAVGLIGLSNLRVTNITNLN